MAKIITGENIGMTSNAAIITWEKAQLERYNPTVLQEFNSIEEAESAYEDSYCDKTENHDIIYRDETSGTVLWYSGDEFEMKQYE